MIYIDYTSMDEKTENIKRNVLGGAKVPHKTSEPVLYKQDDKYYLAAFVVFYTRNDVATSVISRPSHWVIADIETGNIVAEYETTDKEFSNAPYDKKYDAKCAGKCDTSAEYYSKSYTMLEDVIWTLKRTGKIDRELYYQYLDRILANFPKDYRVFFTDLGVSCLKDYKLSN
jgi:hypothetical protein